MISTRRLHVWFINNFNSSFISIVIIIMASETEVSPPWTDEEVKSDAIGKKAIATFLQEHASKSVSCVPSSTVFSIL